MLIWSQLILPGEKMTFASLTFRTSAQQPSTLFTFSGASIDDGGSVLQVLIESDMLAVNLACAAGQTAESQFHNSPCTPCPVGSFTSVPGSTGFLFSLSLYLPLSVSLLFNNRFENASVLASHPTFFSFFFSFSLFLFYFLFFYFDNTCISSGRCTECPVGTSTANVTIQDNIGATSETQVTNFSL